MLSAKTNFWKLENKIVIQLKDKMGLSLFPRYDENWVALDLSFMYSMDFRMDFGPFSSMTSWNNMIVMIFIFVTDVSDTYIITLYNQIGQFSDHQPARHSIDR